ncbi:MAG TPA: VOC family protein, partial [Rhodothermales bacterium]
MEVGRSIAGVRPPAYRLPETIRLGRVRLQVADLARSLAFYSGVLGFRATDTSQGRALLAAQDSADPIVELVERRGANPVPRRGRIGLFHVAYLLPDRAHLARFVRHVADEGVPVGMSDHLVSEAIYLSDPDGLGIEVYTDRPRDAWRVVNREIAMTTMPLNVPDLLRADEDGTWSGAPAGTQVGHVHLHVGDLNTGSAFYHDALGFDRVVWSYPGALFLSAGGYHHHLGTNVWAAGAAPATKDDARLLEWRIVFPT